MQKLQCAYVLEHKGAEQLNGKYQVVPAAVVHIARSHRRRRERGEKDAGAIVQVGPHAERTTEIEEQIVLATAPDPSFILTFVIISMTQKSLFQWQDKHFLEVYIKTYNLVNNKA